MNKYIVLVDPGYLRDAQINITNPADYESDEDYNPDFDGEWEDIEGFPLYCGLVKGPDEETVRSFASWRYDVPKHALIITDVDKMFAESARDERGAAV